MEEQRKKRGGNEAVPRKERRKEGRREGGKEGRREGGKERKRENNTKKQ